MKYVLVTPNTSGELECVDIMWHYKTNNAQETTMYDTIIEYEKCGKYDVYFLPDGFIIDNDVVYANYYNQPLSHVA